MGEYARIQMAEDARRMFGGEWEPEDFEDEPRTSTKPRCPKCGKYFRVHLAVRDHMRDKHKATEAAYGISAAAIEAAHGIGGK